MAIQGICRVFERNLGGWSPRHSLRLTGSCQLSCGLSQSWLEASLAISEFGVNSPQRAIQRWPKKTAANFETPRHIRRMDKVEERERVAVGRRRQCDERVAERHPHARSSFGAMAIRLTIGPHGRPETCGTRAGVFGTTLAGRLFFPHGKRARRPKLTTLLWGAMLSRDVWNTACGRVSTPCMCPRG